MTYNWQDLLKVADEAGFTPLPVGDYHVVVDSAEAKSTATGKDMIKVKFRVLTGPKENKTITNNFVLSPDNANAVGFFFRHMAAMGLTAQFFQQQPPLAQVAQALVGKQCMITVTHREWNGAMRDDVSGVKPLQGNVPGAAPAPGVPTPAPAPSAAPTAPQPVPAPAPVPQPAPVPAPEPVAPPAPVPAPEPVAQPEPVAPPAYNDEPPF